MTKFLIEGKDTTIAEPTVRLGLRHDADMVVLVALDGQGYPNQYILGIGADGVIIYGGGAPHGIKTNATTDGVAVQNDL